MDEAGIKGFEATSWSGLYMPASRDPAVAQKLEAALRDFLSSSEIEVKFARLGVDAGGLVGKDFATVVASEMTKWSDVIVRARIEAQ